MRKKRYHESRHNTPKTGLPGETGRGRGQRPFGDGRILDPDNLKDMDYYGLGTLKKKKGKRKKKK